MVSLPQADKLGYSLIKSDCGHPSCIRKGPADGINASRGQQRKRIHRALGPPDEAMMLRGLSVLERRAPLAARQILVAAMLLEKSLTADPSDCQAVRIRHPKNSGSGLFIAAWQNHSAASCPRYFRRICSLLRCF
ncbi:hypothetical protein F9K82_21510 [Brucella pseudogrignonensis]|nr:hypothetical protein F9K82_21510 [Brucella pseudogrignonensis]